MALCVVISFVVPAYNEELELPATLAAIRDAARGISDYEVVVVDDHSTDRTAELARAAGATVVSIDRRQIAAARNAGAQVARGDVLIFVDADTRIASAHIEGALAALRAGFAGGGARIDVSENIPRWASIAMRLACAVYFGLNLGAGAFLFTTAENFRTVGGFDEQYFAGEEVYFTQALKKIGRFTVLRTPVLTSGRKLRMHSARKILVDSFRIVIRGKRGVRSREKLDLWYDGERETEVSS